MLSEQDFPDISEGAEPPDLAVGLRVKLFKSQRAADEELSLATSTAHRYERAKSIPPLGYLAALMRLIVQREWKKNADQYQAERLMLYFLDQIKRLVSSYSEQYKFQEHFRSWEKLSEAADDFLARHSTKRRLSGPLPHQDERPAGPFLVPPIPVQGVFGREEDLKKIVKLLALDDSAAADVPPLALRGMGGIGKTTLTLAIGHQRGVFESFPDGVLWTAIGTEPVVRLLLNEWGRALGIDLLPERDEAACQLRLKDALYGRKVLLIVDDVWDIAHATYFQVAGPRCRIVFTTREVDIAHALATFERTLSVDVLSPEASLDLLSRLAPQVVASDKARARQLCAKLEFLPLGLLVAGRLLADESAVPERLSTLLGELTERRDARLSLVQAEGRLGGDKEAARSVHAILGMSVDRLDQADQERFAMMSVFGGEPLTWDLKAAAAVWECSLDEAAATTARFIRRGLVERREDRYWTHALLADYADQMREEKGL